MRVALVADDLTGAMDAAAPFALRGATTRVLPAGVRFDPAVDGAYDVVSIDTGSRHLDPAAAAASVRAACLALAACRPLVLFKKIDSTLRGNVVPELLSALDTGLRDRAWLAPAVPAQGRTMASGQVYVRGIPLARTELVHDARMPAPAAPLAELLHQAAPQRTIACAARDVHPDGLGRADFCLIDCETDADFSRLFADPAHLGQVLWVGAAGLGAALARELFTQGERPRPMAGAARAPLFVVGSRTERSALQVAHFAAGRDVRVLQAAAGRLDVDAQFPIGPGTGPSACLIVASPDASDAAPDEVAARLGDAAATLVRRGQVDALFVTGGDTAAAVLHALGVDHVDLAGEVSPGIALTELSVGGRPIPFVSKSGGFGNDDALVQVHDFLCAAQSRS